MQNGKILKAYYCLSHDDNDHPSIITVHNPAAPYHQSIVVMFPQTLIPEGATLLCCAHETIFPWTPTLVHGIATTADCNWQVDMMHIMELISSSVIKGTCVPSFIDRGRGEDRQSHLIIVINIKQTTFNKAQSPKGGWCCSIGMESPIATGGGELVSILYLG